MTTIRAVNLALVSERSFDLRVGDVALDTALGVRCCSSRCSKCCTRVDTVHETKM